MSRFNPAQGIGILYKSRTPQENSMGTLSIWHILILVIVALLLFGGRGKLSDLMGDAAKGITAFRKGLQDSDDDHRDDRRPSIPSDRDKDQVGR